jgi:pilus assembly protein Flp/PilA
MIGALTSRTTRLLRRFAADQSGATAIEYGLIAAFIAVAIVTAVTQVGTNVQRPFQTASDGLQ